jgi:hypothetical protein
MGAEAGQSALQRPPPDSKQADQSDRHEGEVAGHVPEVGNAEEGALVGEGVVRGVLRDGRDEEEEGRSRQPGSEEHRSLHPASPPRLLQSIKHNSSTE